MKLDKRAEQIISMFSDPRSYSTFMKYDDVFKIDTKTAAKEYYRRMKHLNPRVEKRKYYDNVLKQQYEAWYITVNLKHSVIDAFFFPIGQKTRVIILRKDKPYITVIIGLAAIAAIVIFGKLFISLTLNPVKLLEDFIIASVLLGGSIYLSEKLALPTFMRDIIRDFDAAMMPYHEEEIDKSELENTKDKIIKHHDAAAELEES